MQANAYMLIHELRSGFWGKMSDIRQELVNLDKMTHHLVGMYVERTKMSRKTLEKLLSKDAVWNAEESMKRGLVDEVL
jgi:ATP-dependent protease ClpP protease subunit